MKLSKLGLIAVPAALVLAGCAHHNDNAARNDSSVAQAAAAQQQVAAQQLAVYQASTTPVTGYRKVQISDTQAIYVSERPVFTRANVSQASIVRDNQGRSFIALALNPEGQQALSNVDANRGYVTTVGGQVASLSGTRQNGAFLMQTRDEQASAQILRTAFPEQAAAMPAQAAAAQQQAAAAQQQAAAAQQRANRAAGKVHRVHRHADGTIRAQ